MTVGPWDGSAWGSKVGASEELAAAIAESLARAKQGRGSATSGSAPARAAASTSVGQAPSGAGGVGGALRAKAASVGSAGVAGRVGAGGAGGGGGGGGVSAAAASGLPVSDMARKCTPAQRAAADKQFHQLSDMERKDPLSATHMISEAVIAQVYCLC